MIRLLKQERFRRTGPHRQPGFPGVLLTLFIASLVAPDSVTAQPPAKAQERIHLADERIIEGVLLNEGRTTIEFAEVLRRPGQPMQAIVRPYPKSEIVLVDRLKGDAKRQLLRQFQSLRNRAAIEADRREAIQLHAMDDLRKAGNKPTSDVPGAPPLRYWSTVAYPDAEWVYLGEWFVLATSLDAATARRCIVRVEQVFRGYRHLLPPKRRPQRPLVIQLAGDEGEYRRLLSRFGIESAAPALYLPKSNQILASTRLASLGRQLQQAETSHQKIRKQQEGKQAAFAERFAEESSKLAARGYSADEIAAEKRAREAALLRESKSVQNRIDVATRRNDQLFAAQSHRTLRRLYHESFHAYLENYVFQQATRTVPRWLNEGLAQVFEHAQLDGEHLRFDLAPQSLLDAIGGRTETGQQRPSIPFDRLMKATAQDFHGRRAPVYAQQLYAEAWGLSFYLTFHRRQSPQAVLEALRTAEQPADGLRQLLGNDAETVLSGAWREQLHAVGPPNQPPAK